MSVVQAGTVVSIHYTLRNDAGEVLDTSDGHDPLSYLADAENIVPGLDRALMGKSVGFKDVVVVEAADAYGESAGVEPTPVPRGQFPAGMPIQAGMQFGAETPDGSVMPVWVTKVDAGHVYVTPEHPLAGVRLSFTVEIVSVRAASDEEIAHGHPHGPHGHAHDH